MYSNCFSIIIFRTGCVVTPIKATITVDLEFPLTRVFLWMFTGVVLLSISTIMLISFDRFFHVYFLERYNLTKYKLAGALFFCWIGPVVFIIMLASSGRGGGIFVLVYYLFCITAIVIAHVAILKALRRYTLIHLSEDLIKQQEQAAKTTLIIVVAFVAMSIIPVLSIVLALAGITNRGLCASTYFLMLANSAVNPVIYCLRVPRMKDYVGKLLWTPLTTPTNPVPKEGRANDGLSMTEDVLEDRRRVAAGETPELMNVAQSTEEEREAAGAAGATEVVVNVDVNENRRASLYTVPAPGNNAILTDFSLNESNLSLEEIR